MSPFVCVACGADAPDLTRVYSKGNVKLSRCAGCGSVVDKYVEHDALLQFVDLTLMGLPLLRHVLHNEGRPRALGPPLLHALVLALFRLHAHSFADGAGTVRDHTSGQGPAAWAWAVATAGEGSGAQPLGGGAAARALVQGAAHVAPAAMEAVVYCVVASMGICAAGRLLHPRGVGRPPPSLPAALRAVLLGGYAGTVLLLALAAVWRYSPLFLTLARASAFTATVRAACALLLRPSLTPARGAGEAPQWACAAAAVALGEGAGAAAYRLTAAALR
jgi:hypothetical protein